MRCGKGFRLRKGTKRAAALSKVAHETGRWLNLTGTPAPNGLTDLWGPQYFVDFGERLGHTYTAFFDRWFNKNEYTRKITPKEGANAEIMDLIADVTMSLCAKDWFDVEDPRSYAGVLRLATKGERNLQQHGKYHVRGDRSGRCC